MLFQFKVIINVLVLNTYVMGPRPLYNKISAGTDFRQCKTKRQYLFTLKKNHILCFGFARQNWPDTPED